MELLFELLGPAFVFQNISVAAVLKDRKVQAWKSLVKLFRVL